MPSVLITLLSCPEYPLLNSLSFLSSYAIWYLVQRIWRVILSILHSQLYRYHASFLYSPFATISFPPPIYYTTSSSHYTPCQHLSPQTPRLSSIYLLKIIAFIRARARRLSRFHFIHFQSFYESIHLYRQKVFIYIYILEYFISYYPTRDTLFTRSKKNGLSYHVTSNVIWSKKKTISSNFYGNSA